MKTNERISAARSKIAKLLLDQCKNGQQTIKLAPELAACGQFVGNHAHGKVQRGAHGSAAALEVLADQPSPEFIEITQRLVRYIEREWGSAAVDFSEFDQKNIIKISETLHALLKVPRAVAATERLTGDLAKRLIDARRNNRVWPYFIGSQYDQGGELPTAFAVRALARYGSVDLEQSAQYLLSCVTQGVKTTDMGGGSDIYVHIFSLYVLATSRIGGFKPSDADLRALFMSCWSRLKYLGENIEQNLEYWDDWGDEARHFYVRIPWQLYLLALAAQLFPNRILTSVAAESRLQSLIDGVNSTNGFRYPHSGDIPSSRTNAILYEVLGYVDAQSGTRWVDVFRVGVFRVGNKYIDAFSSRSVKFTMRLAAISILGISTYLWAFDSTKSISDLAPEFLNALLIWMLTRRNV